MSNLRGAPITTNPILDKLRCGLPTVGTFLTLSSPVAAEIMANLGWDWLTVDVEHGPVGFETMVSCFRAIQLGGAVPLARVPWNEPAWIQRALDAGALGLIVPMVNSAEDAAAVVKNMRYAPVGQRSLGRSRIATYIEGDYRKWIDENLAVIVMIETVLGVERIEEILKVEGISCCYIGPGDLALSMQSEEQGPGSEHEAAILEVLKSCNKAGIPAGKHCSSAEEVNVRIRQGFQLLALASEESMMRKAAEQSLAAIDRAAFAHEDSPTGRAS